MTCATIMSELLILVPHSHACTNSGLTDEIPLVLYFMKAAFCAACLLASLSGSSRSCSFCSSSLQILQLWRGTLYCEANDAAMLTCTDVDILNQKRIVTVVSLNCCENNASDVVHRRSIAFI